MHYALIHRNEEIAYQTRLLPECDIGNWDIIASCLITNHHKRCYICQGHTGSSYDRCPMSAWSSYAAQLQVLIIYLDGEFGGATAPLRTTLLRSFRTLLTLDEHCSIDCLLPVVPGQRVFS